MVDDISASEQIKGLSFSASAEGKTHSGLR
jgi:hypothetical protein